MSNRTQTTVTTVVLLMFTSIVISANVAAQTPSAAISHFKAGVKKTSRVISIGQSKISQQQSRISSHPGQRFIR